MNHIPAKLNKELNEDPEYRYCARYGYLGHRCAGKITRDHAIIFQGRQVQERWAIIPVCEFGHSVGRFQDAGDHDKEVNLWIALNRATDEEMIEISKVIPYTSEKMRLNTKYGVWEPIIHYEEPQYENSELCIA